MFLLLAVLAGRIGALLAGMLFFVGILAQYLIREKTSPGQVARDERDKAIFKAASLWAGMAFFVTTIVTCMVFVFVGQASVIAYALFFILVAGQIVFWAVRSVVTLVLYGREPKNVQD